MTDLIHELGRRGHRITEPRRAILAALGESRAWLRPEEILTAGRDFHPELSLVTVYRTLDLLVSEDIAHRIHLPGGCNGYALKSPGHNHLLVCTRCQVTLEFPSCDLSDLIGELSRDTGFDVHGHMLEITGTCPECQAGTSRGEA